MSEQRDEFWIRVVDGDERRCHIPVGVGDVVEVSYELLAQMLTDLGWTREDA
jgi:hypothetical protein